MVCDDLGGAEGRSKGGDICIIMANLCCCMAETDTKLSNNFPPINK